MSLVYQFFLEHGVLHRKRHKRTLLSPSSERSERRR